MVTKDPDIAGGFLAIAPNMPDHGALYVKASESFTLSPGEYSLAIANIHSGPSITYRPFRSTAQKSVIQSVQHQGAGVRYAIHLPPPNAIAEESFEKSRLRTTVPVWPVTAPYSEGASTVEPTFEYAYDGSVPIQIQVPAGGGPDPGLSSPTLNTTPTVFPAKIVPGEPALIRIGTEPTNEDLGGCDTQSKATFFKLTHMFQVSAAIDFPGYDPGCQVCDPQGKTPGGACPFFSDLNSLRDYAASVRTPAGATATRDIVAAEEILSGKNRESDRQKDLLMRLTNIQAFVNQFPPPSPVTPNLRNALRNLPIVVNILNIPHKDCKAPVMELSYP